MQPNGAVDGKEDWKMPEDINSVLSLCTVFIEYMSKKTNSLSSCVYVLQCPKFLGIGVVLQVRLILQY